MMRVRGGRLGVGSASIIRRDRIHGSDQFVVTLDVLRSLPSIFLSSVAPPLAVALAGYLLGSIRDVDTDGLSAAAIYVLLPALVFETLVTLTADLATVTATVGAMVGFTFAMGLVALAVSRLRGQEGTVVFLTILGSLPVVTGLVLLAETGILG